MDYRLIVDSYSQGDVDSLVSARRLISDSYSKTETNSLVAGKQDDLVVNFAPLNGQILSFSDVDGLVFIDNTGGADLSNYYTKTEADALYALYRLLSDSYSASQVNATFRTIADSYSIFQTDFYLSTKQDLLLALAHSANQVLAVNATNDALVFVDPAAGADVETYMAGVTGFAANKIYSYDGSIF